jgi:pimeloyl-ACP methyl ester carboxylesterase
LGIVATLGLHTVFIPGWLCSARLYDPLLPVAWEHGAVTVADSRRDDTVHGMAARLLDDAPERFVLVGMSMGGYVAHEVLRQAPDRVSGLALISTSARPDSAEQLANWQSRRQAVLEGRFIHGMGDRAITPENAAETAAAIPGAVLTLVERAGHMLPQEQPAAAHAALTALLDRVTATS